MFNARIIFGALVVALGLGITWLMHDLEVKNEASKSWPQVTGTITKSERYTDSVDIRYRYEVNGESFESRKMFMGVLVNSDITFADAPSISDAGLLSRFPQGADVPVYFDPSNPSLAVLLPTAEPNTTLMKLVFGYLFIVGGLGLILSGFLLTGSRRVRVSAALLFRCILGLGMLGGGAFIVSMMNDIRTESRMTRFWSEVPATIKVAHVWTDHPEIVYTYSVDGREYESDQLFIGMASERITLEDGTELWPRQLDRRFKVGKVVQVRVDPKDPTNAVLLPDANHNTDIPRYIGIAFAVIGPLVAIFGKLGGGGGGESPQPTRQDMKRIKSRRPSRRQGGVVRPE